MERSDESRRLDKLYDRLGDAERQKRKLQAENARLKKEIGALHKELMTQAKQFHSHQYCKCNWCKMYKQQALKDA